MFSGSFCFICYYYCNFILEIIFFFFRSSFPFLFSSRYSSVAFVCIFVTFSAAFLILRRCIKVYTPHLSSTFTYQSSLCVYCCIHYSLSVCFDVSRRVCFIHQLSQPATTCNVNVRSACWSTSTCTIRHFHSLHLYHSPNR